MHVTQSIQYWHKHGHCNDPFVSVQLALGKTPVVNCAFLSASGTLPWLISDFAVASAASMVLFVGNATKAVTLPGKQCGLHGLHDFFLQCGVLVLRFGSVIRNILRDPVGAEFSRILLIVCCRAVFLAHRLEDRALFHSQTKCI